MGEINQLSTSELLKAERAIAARHLDHFPLGSVIWCFVNFVVWLALWPLVFMGILPLWLGFIIATANISLSYLPSHEAQHDIIARPGQPYRWLNQLVGHLSTLPLVLPYSVAKLTHMEHHKHCNHPEKDPDYSTHAPSALAAIWKSILTRQKGHAGGLDAYGACLEAMQTHKANQSLLIAVVYEFVFYGCLFTLAWTGYVFEAAFVWWLPRHIALTYIQFFLSWAPHNPNMAIGRYQDTRAWRSRFGNILSMGMQYHIVHHLYPRIPLMRTPRAYWEMRDILQARGVRIDNL